MHPDIADTERLAIFVLDSDGMREDGAHWKAFLPGKLDGERSFLRIDGLDFCDVAALGQELASQRDPPKQLRGWGVISAGDVRTLCPELRVRSAKPPERHGVIDSWPAEKHEKRSLAQSLAGVAATIRFPFAP